MKRHQRRAKATHQRTPKVKRMTAKQVSEQLAKQKSESTQKALLAKAIAAIKSFKVAKKDFGKLVMVGTNGQRNPQSKGRKGFLAFVSKKGKATLVHVKGQKLVARKISSLQVPYQKRLKNATKKFYAERVELKRGKKTVKSKLGETSFPQGLLKDEKILAAPTFGRNSAAVNAMVNSVEKALQQKSHRQFIVHCMLLVIKPDGSEKVYEFALEYDKADHIAVVEGGIRNWVMQRFYSQMARQLEYDGFITRGSWNHTRKAKRNEGLESSEWTTANGMKFDSEREFVEIKVLEWRIFKTKITTKQHHVKTIKKTNKKRTHRRQ